MVKEAPESNRKNISALRHERVKLLDQITASTDKIMVGLSMIWIGLMIADFLGKLSRPLEWLNYAIWFIFIIDFLVKFSVAPHKAAFLRSHWLVIISLILPAFRLIRIFQALAALRTLSLVRILTSFNRSMGALSVAMGRRGIGYVLILTLLVLFGGAAGMYQFEKPSQLVAEGFSQLAQQGGGLQSYSDSVWWTAMLMTTIGSQYWPVTAAGRVLCFLISVFSLGVFGYITATLAGFFVDSQSGTEEDKAALSVQDVAALRQEINALRQELRAHSSSKDNAE